MKRVLILLIAVSVLGSCARGPKPDPVVRAYYRDSLASLTSRCETILKHPYMSQKRLGKRTDLPGWEGYPVKLWEYTVTDFDTHEQKKGLVYTLNPSPKKLARWMVNAVFDATGNLDPAKIERDLGWRSQHSFESGLAATVDWYLDNRWWWEPIRSGRYQGQRLGQAA